MPKIPGWSKMSRGSWRHDDARQDQVNVYKSNGDWAAEISSGFRTVKKRRYPNRDAAKSWAVSWMRSHPDGA